MARNTGVLQANCSVVAYIDDDVTLHPLFTYNVWQAFQDETVSAMTGLVIAARLDTKAQLIFEKFWSFNRGYVDVVYDESFFNTRMLQGPPVWEIGAGANMAFRKSIFLKAGYFNELLDAGAAGCNGDSEMWFRILLNGGKILYNPRIVVWHEHRREMKEFIQQIYYYMRGFTVAALCQQEQTPMAGYKKKIAEYPRGFAQKIMRGFPAYNNEYKTLTAEIRGVIAGLFFFHRHKKRLLKKEM